MKARRAGPLLQLVLAAHCSFLIVALLASSAFTQQQGGPYILNPSVISGGGGRSANGNTRIEGSIGQSTLGVSIGGSYVVNGGFWPDVIPCPLALSPGSLFFTVAGGPGSVNVVAASSCNWTATDKDDWIVITSSDSGAGNDVVTFEVRENFTGTARQTTLAVAGLNQVIVQDGGLGEDCGYSISPTFESFPASGGAGAINVTAAERCAWQATSATSWVTITSVDIGIGNGTVTYSVGVNPDAPGRKGIILVGGQTFSVKQKGH